jgi:hypothetical protein
MSLYETLKYGPIPWQWRLSYWWRHKVLRKPVPKAELGTWSGVKCISGDDEGGEE